MTDGFDDFAEGHCATFYAESYEEFLTTLAKASGIETPTRADLARIDRKRKKKGSNDDWTHPHDPDARMTKMKGVGTPRSLQGRSAALDVLLSIVRTLIDDAMTAIAYETRHLGEQPPRKDGRARRVTPGRLA